MIRIKYTVEARIRVLREKYFFTSNIRLKTLLKIHCTDKNIVSSLIEELYLSDPGVLFRKSL